MGKSFLERLFAPLVGGLGAIARFGGDKAGRAPAPAPFGGWGLALVGLGLLPWLEGRAV